MLCKYNFDVGNEFDCTKKMRSLHSWQDSVTKISTVQMSTFHGTKNLYELLVPVEFVCRVSLKLTSSLSIFSDSRAIDISDSKRVSQDGVSPIEVNEKQKKEKRDCSSSGKMMKFKFLFRS